MAGLFYPTTQPFLMISIIFHHISSYSIINSIINSTFNWYLNMVLDGCIQLDASLNWPSGWIRGFLAPATCSPHSCGSPHDAAPWRRPSHCRNAPKMATEEMLEKIGDLWLLAMENGWKYMENRRKWMKTYGKCWKCYGKWMKIYRNGRNWMKKIMKIAYWSIYFNQDLIWWAPFS